MFEQLDKWMNRVEEDIYNRLVLTRDLINTWRTQKKLQATLDVNGYDDSNSVWIPEMRSCSCWKISPNWRREFVNGDTLIIQTIKINDKSYDDVLYVKSNHWSAEASYKRELNYNGLKHLLFDNDCDNQSNFSWFDGYKRTDSEIRDKAHKEMLNHKKAIEMKVYKICGKDIEAVNETNTDIYVKGTNGRTAHLWAIEAGGYNQDIIVNERHGQCLHIRVLVKEVK